MQYQKVLWPFTRDVVNQAIKSLKDSGRGGPEIDEVKEALEELFLTNPEVAVKIKDLVEKELRIPPPAPRSAVGLSAFIRPLITASLTAVFCFLIYTYVKPPDNVDFNHLKEALTVFLGVYGPIIGFWFGEKTALKVPGAQT